MLEPAENPAKPMRLGSSFQLAARDRTSAMDRFPSKDAGILAIARGKPLSEHERHRAVALVFGQQKTLRKGLSKGPLPWPSETFPSSQSGSCNSRPTWRRPAFCLRPTGT